MYTRNLSCKIKNRQLACRIIL